MISQYRRRWYGYIGVLVPCIAGTAFLIAITGVIAAGSAPLFALIPLALIPGPVAGAWWVLMITPSAIEVHSDGRVLLLARRRKIEIDVRGIRLIEVLHFNTQFRVYWGLAATTLLLADGIPHFKRFVTDLTSLNSGIDVRKVSGWSR